MPYPRSFSFCPSITADARSTIGTSVTLLIYGTVRDARGLTSMTYSSLSNTRYWILTKPFVPSASARSVEHLTILSVNLSVRLYGGYTAMESPLCTPARSMCSMIPGMSTSVPSEMTSTSSSVPGIYLSTSTGLSIPPARIFFIYTDVVSSLLEMIIFCPPIT